MKSSTTTAQILSIAMFLLPGSVSHKDRETGNRSAEMNKGSTGSKIREQAGAWRRINF